MTVTIEDLKAHYVQFGHRTQKWNPKMKRYLYGSAGGIHIFDLAKTAKAVQELVEYLQKAAQHGKTILFVSTKPQIAARIQEIAERTNNPYVTNKWFGGLLTNFDTMKERIRYYKNLLEERDTGGFDRFTKKEIAQKNKEIAKLQTALGGIVNLRRLPDVLFVVDAHRDEIAVKEARKLKIPVAGFVDSNCDPDLVDVKVPANDDALRSLTFLLGLVEQALLTTPKKDVPAAPAKKPVETSGARTSAEEA